MTSYVYVYVYAQPQIISTDSVRVVRVDAHLRRHIIFVDTNNMVRCCLVNVGWMLVVTDFE